MRIASTTSQSATYKGHPDYQKNLMFAEKWLQKYRVRNREFDVQMEPEKRLIWFCIKASKPGLRVGCEAISLHEDHSKLINSLQEKTMILENKKNIATV